MTAEEIKATRRAMNLTQTEFANVIGVSMRAIQTYEQGKSAPNSNALVKLIELKAKYLKEIDLTKTENEYLKGLDQKYANLDPLEIVMFLTRNHHKLMEDPIYESFIKNIAYELAIEIIAQRFIGKKGE